MSIFRSTSDHSATSSTPSTTAASPAAPAGRILLVGEEFGWLPGDAKIAGRTIARAVTKDEAVALLAEGVFDGLISGLPEIGKSLALINTALRDHPAIACGLRAETAQVAKLSLPYPIIPPSQAVEVLDDYVQTMFATTGWNANPAFIALKAEIKRFPALPTLYTEITTALQNPDSSIEDLANLVAREPAISAKLLQVVNSPVFALRHRVASIRDAANFLGMQRLRALVLSTSLISQCDASRCQCFGAETFENFSLQIANWAADITVGETRDRRLGEMAFTAGLLHQFGVLLLAANLPEKYDHVLRTAAEQNVSVARIERQVFGATHAELAGFMLASWHIPFPIVNAVGFHAVPSHSSDQTLSPLTAVHVATTIDSFVNVGIDDFDRPYLTQLNLLPRVNYWSRVLTERECPLAA